MVALRWQRQCETCAHTQVCTHTCCCKCKYNGRPPRCKLHLSDASGSGSPTLTRARFLCARRIQPGVGTSPRQTSDVPVAAGRPTIAVEGAPEVSVREPCRILDRLGNTGGGRKQWAVRKESVADRNKTVPALAMMVYTVQPKRCGREANVSDTNWRSGAGMLFISTEPPILTVTNLLLVPPHYRPLGPFRLN